MKLTETDPEIWREIEQEFEQLQQAETIFGPVNAQPDQTTPLVVGISGGADSVCLLAALTVLRNRLCQNLGVCLELHAAHLDHGLRPSSTEDAAFVEDLAQEWGIPFHIRRLPPDEIEENDQNVEAFARESRYRFLAQLASELTPTDQVPRIATAHTLDDQAETLLMQLIRGAGLSGLAAMRPVTSLAVEPPFPENKTDLTGSPPLLLRPFLYVPRTLLLRALHEAQIPWREDPTNQDLGFTRNWLRHEIIPQLAERQPGVKESLGRTATILAGEADHARQRDQMALQRLLLEEETGRVDGADSMDGADAMGETNPVDQTSRIVLDLDGWRRLSLAAQRGVLRQAWLRLGQSFDALGFDHIEAIRLRAISQDDQGGPYTLLDGFVWSLLDGRLAIHADEALPIRLHHPHLTRLGQRMQALEESNAEKFDAEKSAPEKSAILSDLEQQIQLPIPQSAGDQQGTLLLKTPLLKTEGWQLWANIQPIHHLPPTWKTNPDPWQAFLDWEESRSLSLTVHQPGMQISPLGMAGQHKSVGDLFTDCKVPPALRAGWPILIDDSQGEVLWVCGLRISHHACITSATRQVLHLRWEEIKSTTQKK